MPFGVDIGSKDVGAERVQGACHARQETDFVTCLDLDPPAALPDVHDTADGTSIGEPGTVRT